MRVRRQVCATTPQAVPRSRRRRGWPLHREAVESAASEPRRPMKPRQRAEPRTRATPAERMRSEQRQLTPPSRYQAVRAHLAEQRSAWTASRVSRSGGSRCARGPRGITNLAGTARLATDKWQRTDIHRLTNGSGKKSTSPCATASDGTRPSASGLNRGRFVRIRMFSLTPSRNHRQACRGAGSRGGSHVDRANAGVRRPLVGGGLAPHRPL